MAFRRQSDADVREGNAALYRLIARSNEVPLHELIDMGPGALTGWLRAIEDMSNLRMLQNAQNAGNLILGFPPDFEREVEESRKVAGGPSRLCPVKFE